MLLSLWIAFVVLDEVDDWGAPVGVKSQDCGRTTLRYTSFSVSNTSTSITNGPSGSTPI